MLLHKFLLWIHLLSMAGIFGMLFACQTENLRNSRVFHYFKMFLGLLFVSGFGLAYLRFVTAFSNGIEIHSANYHILITKFILLLGLAHFIVMGMTKNRPGWTSYALIMVALATGCGILLRSF